MDFLIYIAGLVVCCLAPRTRWISQREAMYGQAGVTVVWAAWSWSEGDYFTTGIAASIAGIDLWVARHMDDDDRPRKRRQRARSSAAAKLRPFAPSPILTPAVQ